MLTVPGTARAQSGVRLLRGARLDPPSEGYLGGADQYVKEDVMYVSIGSILAIILVIVLLAWLL
jgi:hypothetical protein